MNRLLLTIVLACCASGQAAEDVSGKWKIRINGGGEIYTALLDINESENGLIGTYEIDGRRTRLKEAGFTNNTLTVVVNTQRFSTPVVATFVADLENGRLAGEVAFDTGTRSTAYDFEATRLGQVSNSQAKTNHTPADEDTENSGKPPQPESADLSFRNGVNGYSEAVDAEIWAIAPSKSLLRQGTMTTDGNNGGGESQVLLRFEEIIGNEAGKIPQGARIRSARLTVVAFDPGTTCYLHRLLVPWSTSVTWDGMANGITVDNIEASTVRDGFTFAEINMDKQMVHFDVAPTVQLWADGVENFGWVFVNTGGNGWDFYSSDWLEKEFRPMLEVSYSVNSNKTSETNISLNTTFEKAGSAR